MRAEWVRGRTGTVTQMHYARQGVVTEEMRHVAALEGLDAEIVRREIACGRLIIPANVRHPNIEPMGIGIALKTKINANIGNSPVSSGAREELEKLSVSVRYGADAVMDLSTGGDIREIRAAILAASPVPIGTVPIYEAVARVENPRDLNIDLLLDVIRNQAEQGVDFMTVHSGLLREHLPLAFRRVTGIVSRGGSILARWMVGRRRENPLFECFDDILEICRAYDVALSLGDGLRPGCLADASDAAQFAELDVLGELTVRAWEKDVQVMIEGPGHIPFHEIAMNVEREREVCHDAPFYVLGPVVTDVAPGYDHITSCIGATAAAAAGAAMICYVTPKEHLGLPGPEDVKQGLIAYRIAAHAGDIARGRKGARDWDDAISRARYAFDWEKQFELALDPETARAYRAETLPLQDGRPADHCSMCGPDFCSMRITAEARRAAEMGDEVPCPIAGGPVRLGSRSET